MKNILLLLACVQIFCFAAPAEATVRVGARGAVFVPISKRYRDVYAEALPAVGLEAVASFCGCFNAWADVDYFWSSDCEECCKTSIDLVNTAFGLGYFFPVAGTNFTAQLGAGPAVGYMMLNNRSCCLDEPINRTVIGGLLKAGVYYDFCTYFYAHAFTDYIYMPVTFDHTCDLGGFKFGLGLGLRF